MSWTNCGSYWKVLLDPTCTEEQVANYIKPPSTPMPPVVSSTLPNGVAIPVVPASGEEAAQTIQAITNQQIRDWQTQVQSFFDELAGPSTASNTAIDTGTWWKVGLIGLGVGLVINALGKRGR